MNETGIETIRVPLPKKRNREMFASADLMMGANHIRVRCIDGVTRMGRIKGKIKKRVWIREGDILIVVPWSFQDEAGNFTTPSSGAQNTQIEITFNGNSFNNDNIYWDNLCLGYMVPVELTSFTALSNGADVEINWATSTETNNQGFQIERMYGSGSFEQIGFVAGFGTTTEPKAYSFVDTKLETGSYTYRLKQIDFDGSYTYSSDVSVEVELPLEYSLDQNYPNPFNPATTIKYAIAEDGLV